MAMAARRSWPSPNFPVRRVCPLILPKISGPVRARTLHQKSYAASSAPRAVFSRNMSSTVLIQQASGTARPLLELSAQRHANYCARHGITYWAFIGDVQFKYAPHWNKIVLIRHALALGFQTVAWLDADTLIVRDEEDIRTALNG